MNIFRRISRLIGKLIYNLFFKAPCENEQPKISILIPFSSEDKIRKRSFKWLLKYWKHELPDAEIIIGKSNSEIFCKSEALNNAFKESTGKVIVVMDSDAYISGKVIEHCADRILEEIDRGHRLWYVPYRHLYRLTKEASERILESDPKHPYRFPEHPADCFIENAGDVAMCTVMPREAIEILGCFDERFDKGWGGEDIALLRALDTLYAKHKTTKNSILHIWHPFYGANYKTRTWAKQEVAGGNTQLANKYNRATGRPSDMRHLINEGCRKDC
jgi:glycosyltransferase involved in cell wall biosynthesis